MCTYPYSTGFDVKKTSSILLKSSVRCRKPGPGVRHALWREVVKKILKIGRLMILMDLFFMESFLLSP